MRLTKTLQLADRTVTVRELTVRDIRDWLKSLETPLAETDLVSAALIDGASLDDLDFLTDLSAAEIDTLTPSEIRQVLDLAREVNADFFALRDRLAEIGRAALAATPPAPAAN